MALGLPLELEEDELEDEDELLEELVLDELEDDELDVDELLLDEELLVLEELLLDEELLDVLPPQAANNNRATDAGIKERIMVDSRVGLCWFYQNFCKRLPNREG